MKGKELIHSIYIFHVNGQLLYTKEINREEGFGKNRNPDLISGLLAAISQFAKELGGKGIQKIQMEEKFAIIGITSPTYFIRFVILTDLEDDTSECYHFLKRCRQSFSKRYRDKLEKIKKGALINTDLFTDWEENLSRFLEETEFVSIKDAMSGTIKEIAKFSKKKRKN